MALKDLTVVTAEHSEEGALLEFWQDSERKIAIIQRVALDDTFDKLLPFGSPQRRLALLQWNRVVQENLAGEFRGNPAERSGIYWRSAARCGRPAEPLTTIGTKDGGDASRKNAITSSD
jgi:hypothetical protein